MSKAEDLAIGLFPLLETDKIGNNPYISYNTEQLAKQEGFIRGYHQAEKDLSDQTKKAVEIARKEIYDWLEENAVKFVGLADNEHPAIGDTKAFYGTKSLIHYLRQTMKYA